MDDETNESHSTAGWYSSSSSSDSEAEEKIKENGIAEKKQQEREEDEDEDDDEEAYRKFKEDLRRKALLLANAKGNKYFAALPFGESLYGNETSNTTFDPPEASSNIYTEEDEEAVGHQRYVSHLLLREPLLFLTLCAHMGMLQQVELQLVCSDQ